MILCDITERVEAQHSALEMQNLYQQMATASMKCSGFSRATSVVADNRAYET